jgi:cell division septation protein DedD
MRRVVAGMVVVVLAVVVVPALVGAPAEGQGSSWPTMTPEAPRVTRSAGEVVLTFRTWWAARVRYMTFDGTCEPPPGEAQLHQQFKNTPCEPEARAPEDYTAVDGEGACSTSGPCSVTIRIPIVDDGLAEGTKAFTVIAWEEPNTYSPYAYDGPTVIVRIIDDDGTDATGGKPATGSGTSATTAVGAPSSSSGPQPPVTGAAAGDPARPPTTTSPSLDLEVALPTGELRPGPGFELTIDESPNPIAERGGRGRGSPPWLAFGLGTGAVGVAALAFVHRRRQWSSTQA